LLVGGTASHVGKSWMATAICGWLRRRGVRVAPFKAQNMSNNSYPCACGGEIGRAQVAQAEACGLEPSVDMNPILLKPTSAMGSQVVVQGKVWRNLSAREYYEHHEYLREKVEESYARLAAAYEFVVVEGAGSIAELNLRQTDLVNLGFAARHDIPVLLVADIDRGGVYGSVFGTIELLAPAERELVRAFAINRFRGDPSLFASGAKLLEEKTGKRCLGVFPFLENVHLDEEDSVSLDTRPAGTSRLAAIRFPRISNFTDFRLLPVVWIDRAVDRKFEIVILPGSKNTIADLAWMRAQGLDEWLLEQHAAGARIIGICGGYQMLGERVEDPGCIETEGGLSADGLGLLPVKTTLLEQKVTRTVNARTRGGHPFRAYEIHMGETTRLSEAPCFAYLDGAPEGIESNGCLGTYLHGAFEDPTVIEEYLGYRAVAGASKAEIYERLAEWFTQSADCAFFERAFLR
jgi:adenosylcobyric acid synthase